jgi:hypothetical protein
MTIADTASTLPLRAVAPQPGSGRSRAAGGVTGDALALMRAVGLRV